MKVLTSAKIRRDIREKLASAYPELAFIFCTSMGEAEEHLPEAEVLITYGEDVTERHIERAKQLKWIMVISAGIDQMPFDVITKRKIVVTNASGIHKIPMAEYTIAMMLQVARKTKDLLNNERNKRWERKLTMNELHGKTIGILGTGAIGQEIAKLSKAFGMNTIGMNRSGRQVDHFDEIIENKGLTRLLNVSDYVVSVLPRTKETDQLLTKKQFSAMKNEGILINIGRGNVINENDLIEALKEGQLAHAVLDVFQTEPLPEDHPFWELDNVTVTPHMSGLSPEYQPRAMEIFEKNLKEYLSKQENYLNLVDPTKGY